MASEKEKLIQDLERRGYKEFTPPPFSMYEDIEHAFQKRFDDEVGKKYFIDCYIYKDMTHPHTGKVFPGAVEYESQFRDKETGNPLNLQFFAGWDIDAVEDRFGKLFESGMFAYYEKW